MPSEKTRFERRGAGQNRSSAEKALVKTASCEVIRSNTDALGLSQKT